MVTVKKVAGGRARIRGVGRVDRGDRVDVSEDTASYLCEERGDFERVESDGADEESEDICGVEMSDGTICDRDPDECPYHGED